MKKLWLGLSAGLVVVALVLTPVLIFAVDWEGKPSTVEVTFNTGGGSSISNQVVAHGGKVSRPADPSRANHEFIDWYTNNSFTTLFNFDLPLTKDTTIYARWVQIFVVTFNSAGGSAVASQTVRSGSVVTQPAPPTRFGYAFVGWVVASEGDELYVFTTPVTANTTIWAKWAQVATYTVTFETDGGTSVSPQVVETGQHATRPAMPPTRDGYRFDDWYTELIGGSIFAFSQVKITQDTTIYARWEEANNESTARAVPEPAQFETVPVTIGGETRNVNRPKVLDSFTDGTNNFFLLDVGLVRSTYVHTIFGPHGHLQGGPELSLTRQETTTDSVTQGTTQSVSNTMAVSMEGGYKYTVSASAQAKFPVATVRAGISVETSFSVKASLENTRSFSTNVSHAQSVTTSLGTTFSFPSNTATGHWRLALYANTEVFMVVTTNRDNTDLIAFEEVSIASEFSTRVDFNPAAPTFDNTPVSPIDFPEIDKFFIASMPVPELQFAQVSAGMFYSLAVTPNGELFAWGHNGRTGLGIDSGNTLVPTRVGTATNWASVSAGNAHSLAVTTSGQLFAWGRNDNGATGLGTSSGNTLTPTQVGTATNWASASAGGVHSLAVTTSGQLFAWGRNANGEAGLGATTGDTLTPTRVGSATNWASASAGGVHSLAVTTGGQLFAWGPNENGRTGLGTDAGNTLIPTRVGTATNWASVSAGGRRSLAVTTGRQLFAWGSNAYGQTGLGTASGDTLIPTRIGTATNWASVSAGDFHSLAVTTSGQLFAWGRNLHGRTGLGTASGDTLIPTRIGTATNWASVSAGESHSLAVTTGRQLFAWGLNESGKTGLGTISGNTLTPTRVVG